MNDSNPRIERTFYPNGQLQSETPYVGDKITGVVRRWHENGVLQSEMPKLGSLDHGTTREWSSDGQLFSSGEFNHGTGVFRGWYPDGRLKSETWVRDRIPHGRLRAWDENGELIAEQYFISGRKVSRKKYFEACEKDDSLPKYDPNDAPPTWADLYPEMPIEAPNVSLAQYPDAREAVGWLKESSTDALRTLGELPSAEESIRLVEEFLVSGATRVLAVNIDFDEDDQTTGQLLIELPDDAGPRKRALAFCNEQNQQCGFSPVTDAGQKFVLVGLD